MEMDKSKQNCFYYYWCTGYCNYSILMPDITNLLNDIKKYRSDMVAGNYPYQEISDIITKWEEHLAEVNDVKDHKTD